MERNSIVPLFDCPTLNPRASLSNSYAACEFDQLAQVLEMLMPVKEYFAFQMRGILTKLAFDLAGTIVQPTPTLQASEVPTQKNGLDSKLLHLHAFKCFRSRPTPALLLSLFLFARQTLRFASLLYCPRCPNSSDNHHWLPRQRQINVNVVLIKSQPCIEQSNLHPNKHV
jgi:hypothetical protein